MEEPHLLTKEEDGILIATMNRPKKLNAMSRQMLTGFRTAVEHFRDSAHLKVMLIRATGRYFCAGADLLDMSMPDFGDNTSLIRTWYRTEMGGTLGTWLEMEAVEKPVVVAHHAMCVGGGLEMSLSCDFRLAATSAGYSFPEAKFASLPATGGVSRLTRLVGPHWARWLIMADQSVTAERALTMGLVHEVWPDDVFEEKVMAFCRHLAGQPREMMGMTKVAIELAADLQSTQARNVERLANSALHLGEEYKAMFAAIQARLAAPKSK